MPKLPPPGAPVSNWRRCRVPPTSDRFPPIAFMTKVVEMAALTRPKAPGSLNAVKRYTTVLALCKSAAGLAAPLF